jgi:hypothetical protein
VPSGTEQLNLFSLIFDQLLLVAAQPHADLINARLQLRLSAGRNLLAAKSSHGHDMNVWKRQCKMGAAAGDPSPAAPIITRYI